ncbi:MAG: hydroxymethylcytosylglucuronate/cytosylglucuronate synthase [Pseudonocardiales bacterium]|nr:hydroxymethylcytosylglucuronate/cytosylglucuronate synthase [Pseudonocardiales bacterium]
MNGNVIICGADFGYGSAGKLAAMAEQLRIPFIKVGTTLGADVLTEVHCVAQHDYPSDVDELHRIVRRHTIQAALVVLDPLIADMLHQCDVPVVYVDSLPYLWTAADPVPVDASAYCAQLCTSLPQSCWAQLRRIRDLRWVEAIVSSVPQQAAPSGPIVVNVGGVGSPSLKAEDAAYPAAVLPAVLEGLTAAGRPVVVTGNVPQGLREELQNTYASCDPVGTLSHPDFLALLSSSSLLLTSPGMTTILEAGALGHPTVLLPPQNLSQMLNARLILDACGTGETSSGFLDWPTTVIDQNTLAQRRQLGEQAAIGYIYQRIASAGFDRAVYQHLTQRVRALSTSDDGLARRYAALIGVRGARQVADVVERTIAA